LIERFISRTKVVQRKNSDLTFHFPKNNYGVCYDKKWQFLLIPEIQFLNIPFEIK
jgi:hypothetical protein